MLGLITKKFIIYQLQIDIQNKTKIKLSINYKEKIAYMIGQPRF